VEDLVRRLLEQAYLFDDPGAYEAGVRDALAVLDAVPGLQAPLVSEVGGARPAGRAA
jgi:hypothetical protein